MITAYFDGACEPRNPGGTASFGAVIFISGKKIWECSKLYKPKKGRERETSNNIAEYHGLIAILKYLKKKKLHKEKIEVFGDSNMVIQQMFGRWQIKQGLYVPYAHEAKKLLQDFSNIKGNWIPREQNSIADELSKATLLKAGVKFRIQPQTAS